jgi:hypothetical protein
MPTNLSEAFVAQINENVFFAEFAFDAAHLTVPGSGEVEVADHLVIVDDLGILFQLKERSPDAPSDAASMASWFAKKVRKAAVRQVANTKRLLSTYGGTPIGNHRGHLIPLPKELPKRLASVVIYAAPEVPSFAPPKYCLSKQCGFVHFIRAADYLGVCRTLLTPTEVLDYLEFRERAVHALIFSPTSVSEEALVGQFMGGDLNAIPNERYSLALDALLEDTEAWDISFLTRRLGEQITYREGDASATSHYRILAEIAKLSRSELRQMKERLVHTLKAVKADEFRLPYRFSVPRTDCGFLMFPVPVAMHAKARIALQNSCLASKHELKVTKHVGLSIRQVGAFIDIEWMFVSGPLEPNPEIDAMLRDNYPFRPVRGHDMPRYQFDSDELHDAIGEFG